MNQVIGSLPDAAEDRRMLLAVVSRPRLPTMNEFSRTLIDRSGYEGDRFAEIYDRYRPVPPTTLLDVLTVAAQVDRPRLVVDMGAGTGLSTRVWADRASMVVGIEPNPTMLARAHKVATAPNVTYVQAFASGTGLTTGVADIVTCAQSFHWMEPLEILTEAARLLRGGGVFAAYDYDVPPVVHPEVDAAFTEHFDARRKARRRLGLEAGTATWPKEHHLDRIRASARFRFAREVVCHGRDEVDAEGLIGLAESVGCPRGLVGEAAPEVDETFRRFVAVTKRALGDTRWPMIVPYRIRLGVT
jgi:SAM-dependent methyltransferase